MTKHTIKTNDYQGEGRGKVITLRFVIDESTLDMLTTSNADKCSQKPVETLRQAVRRLAARNTEAV